MDGYLACFHILVITSNAAVNIGMHISFQISVLFSLNKYPEVELMYYTASLFLIFRGVSILFPIMSILRRNPTNSM